MAKHGRKYREAAAKVDISTYYQPREAVALARETAITKFDSTIEVHIRMGVDPRHAEQQVRETVQLPHGLGKKVRVLVFAEGDEARAAPKGRAGSIAHDEALTQIQG